MTPIKELVKNIQVVNWPWKILLEISVDSSPSGPKTMLNVLTIADDSYGLARKVGSLPILRSIGKR